jgi:inner membrane protein
VTEEGYAATPHLRSSRHNWLWIVFLLAIASIPDIDYLIPALRVQQFDRTLRITHSFVGVLLIPILTISVLWLLGRRGKPLQIQSLQLVLAGLSHLLLDLLTGVFPLPLLYPFSNETFRLPFGLLPSAGRIQVTNYFLYRNLFIELGAIVPLSISVVAIAKNSTKSIKDRLIIAAGLFLSACFMFWAFNLDR